MKVNITVAVLILSVPLANLLVTSCYVCVASQSFYPKTVSSRTELDEIGFLKTFDLFIQQTSSDLTDDWEEVCQNWRRLLDEEVKRLLRPVSRLCDVCVQ